MSQNKLSYLVDNRYMHGCLRLLKPKLFVGVSLNRTATALRQPSIGLLRIISTKSAGITTNSMETPTPLLQNPLVRQWILHQGDFPNIGMEKSKVLKILHKELMTLDNKKMEHEDKTLLQNATFVGEVGYGHKKYTGSKYSLYESTLDLKWCVNFPASLKNKQVSMAYIIVVNGKIYKIGQSSGEGGIKSCMAFYLNAGTDVPGPNRFMINYLMREELTKESKIDIYMVYMEPIKVNTPSLLGCKEILVPVSAKGIEQNCLEEYKKNYNGENPPWNFQENNQICPEHISLAFAQYREKRASKPIEATTQ
jgi:hypothetical protein